MLNLNFDMLGSPNPVNFVYDGDGSDGGPAGPAGSAEIEGVFLDYFRGQNLPTLPTAFDGRSDYGPFIDQGIAAGGLFSGAEGLKTPEQAAGRRARPTTGAITRPATTSPTTTTARWTSSAMRRRTRRCISRPFRHPPWWPPSWPASSGRPRECRWRRSPSAARPSSRSDGDRRRTYVTLFAAAPRHDKHGRASGPGSKVRPLRARALAASGRAQPELCGNAFTSGRGSRSYIRAAMKFDDLTYWTDFARQAEAELEAATGRTALNAAAKKLLLARRELKRLEQKAGSNRQRVQTEISASRSCSSSGSARSFSRDV